MGNSSTVSHSTVALILSNAELQPHRWSYWKTPIPDTSINRLREIFAQDNVAVVKEGEKIVGMVTKIDLIDYLHRTGA